MLDNFQPGLLYERAGFNTRLDHLRNCSNIDGPGGQAYMSIAKLNFERSVWQDQSGINLRHRGRDTTAACRAVNIVPAIYLFLRLPQIILFSPR